MATDSKSHLVADLVCKIRFHLSFYGVMIFYSRFQLLSASECFNVEDKRLRKLFLRYGYLL